nr:substrate-binding domain-containing protein [Amycolatopsis acididurans]
MPPRPTSRPSPEAMPPRQAPRPSADAPRPASAPLPPRQMQRPPVQNDSGFTAFTNGGNGQPARPGEVSQQRTGLPPRRVADNGGRTAFREPAAGGRFTETPQERSDTTRFIQDTPQERTGGTRRAGDGTGSGRPVREPASEGTGGHRTQAGSAAETTGGFRSRAGNTGFRAPAEGRAETTGSHRTRAEPPTGTTRRAGETTGSHRRVRDPVETTGTGRRLRDTGDAGETGTGETTMLWSRFSSGQTATGHHRAIGKAAGRRRIAKWPIAVGVAVLVLVVGLLGWGWANNVLNSRAEAQAAGCAEGDATMKVLVAPAVQAPVTAAANRWNQAKTVVHSHCVTVEVHSMASDRALDGLTGRNNLDSIGGLPAAWISDNRAAIDQLQAAKPGMIASTAETIATGPSATYSFVGLTSENLDETQARAAQVFRDYLHQPAQRADFAAAGLAQG